MPQKAVVITGSKQVSLVSDRPLPTLRDDYILIKTVCVALNPTDWKHVEYDFGAPGCVVGCDYSGIVEEVGKNVKKSFRKGDRVFGFTHGSNAVQPEDGCFAEYIVAKGDLQMHIPDSLSFQDAATLGVGISTVGQGLYQSLKLALPTESISQPEPILIYGGSTATGSLAIQYAKLSGYHVLTTCSLHNFDLVKKLGADAAWDYRDDSSAAEIRAATNDSLRLAFDTISLDNSAQFCDHALSTKGGEYSNLLDSKIDRGNVNSRATLGYTVIGEAFQIHNLKFPAIPEDREFGEMFWKLSEPLIAEGKIKVHPPKVCADGLEGVLHGMQLLKEGRVSGQKLVYNVAETP
ncbi:chaperonin 10-like protein [Aspergillus bertholletiae]|uniref:Chaperonin 10-like protein n=1 Tax=Aspergillus bertholletiae TaxID=1226010 RepID=A0A5N7ANV1_9EURO|nr:chaperonin 10-like protein [Aspergillus bertholletiae]